jgi:hypothetical protein
LLTETARLTGLDRRLSQWGVPVFADG